MARSDRAPRAPGAGWGLALVYPEDGEVFPRLHRIRNDRVEALVRTVPVASVGSGFVALERRAAALARELIAELIRELAAGETTEVAA